MGEQEQEKRGLGAVGSRGRRDLGCRYPCSADRSWARVAGLASWAKAARRSRHSRKPDR